MTEISETFMKYFTKKECYPNQKEAMERIYEALETGKAVLFEGACGTGKTLSSLAPALDVAEKQKKVVIIVTNVHQQMVQFIHEAREIREQIPLKVVVVKGKKSMCPEHLDYEECRARTENTYELIKMENERQKLFRNMEEDKNKYRVNKNPAINENIRKNEEMIKKTDTAIQNKRVRSCPYLYEVVKSDESEFRKWVFEDVRTPEEINEYALMRGMCGYELLKKEMKRARLVICNYHHVLNREIFTTLLVWLEKSPEDVIVIFDEAHNIENAARSHSSIKISERIVDRAINEIEENKDFFPEEPRTDSQKIWNAFYEAIRDVYTFKLGPNAEKNIGQDWTDIRISDPTERFDIIRERFLKKIEMIHLSGAPVFEEKKTIQYISSLMRSISRVGRTIEETYLENYKNGTNSFRKSYLSRTADFLDAYLILYKNPNYYPVLNVRKDQYSDKGEIYGRVELFTCIPREVTRDLFNVLGGIVLMSATLRPFHMIRQTLGLEKECVEISYNTTFPEERRRTYAVYTPPLFSSRRSHRDASDIVEFSIVSAIRATPGNVLIYFQSSSEAIRYGRLLKVVFGEATPIFIDEPRTSSNRIREDFFKIGEKGGKSVLVSYILGTLSEGIDFRHGRARTVIIVGIGYPALNDKVRAVEAAYDTVFGQGTGWDFAILTPTMRRIRQAMGRIIRSPTDYGVRLLLDARYQKTSPETLGKYSVFNHFPEEEQREIIDINPKEIVPLLSNFFSGMK